MLWKLETTFSGLCFQEGRSPKKVVATSKDEYMSFKQSVVQVCLLGSPNSTHQVYRFLFSSQFIKSFFKHSLPWAKIWRSLFGQSFGRTITSYRTIGNIWSLVWWILPIITAFGKPRQEDNHEFKTSLCCLVSSGPAWVTSETWSRKVINSTYNFGGETT